MLQDFNANSRLSHLDADTDTSITAIHHTLGPAPTQASPGSHRHDGTDSHKINVTDLEGTIVATNGVPAGGLADQVLTKIDGTDYNVEWSDATAITTTANLIKHYVKNDSGTTLAKGTVVYVSGANGTNILVKPALATSDATTATTLGFLAQSLANNAYGYVVSEGLLTGLNTSAASAGDPIWLSGTTAGGVIYGLANEPHAPVHIVYLGTVTRSNSNNGEIFIKVNNGWELQELHNVDALTPSNGDLLKYDSATSLWKNAAQSTLTIAPSQVTGTAVITTDSRLSNARTPTAHASTHASGGSDPITNFTGAGTAITGVQSAAGVNLPISSANGTTTSGVVSITTGTTSTSLSTSGAIEIKTGNGNGAGNSSGSITIQSGNGSGSTNTSGNIVIDSGTANAGTGSITIGGTNSTTINIGKTSSSSVAIKPLTVAGYVTNTAAGVLGTVATLPASKTVIQTVTLSGTSSISFSSIPSTYRDLELRILATTAVSTSTTLTMTVNGLATNIYLSVHQYVNGVAPGTITYSQQTASTSANLTPQTFGATASSSLILTIPSYTSGSFKTSDLTWMGGPSSGTYFHGFGNLYFKTTSAISSITIAVGGTGGITGSAVLIGVN